MTDKTQRFVARARAVHSDKYTYNNTVYIHSMQKVLITCPIHGDFSIAPNNHLSLKQGCQKCSKRHRPTLEEFINDAKQIHNNKYDYSNVVYVNNHIKIEIICPDHGPFLQQPKDHTRASAGCPECKKLITGQYHKKDTAWFVETATQIHGSRYDYNKVEYQRYHDKVEIICPEHGSFFQTAGSHIHNKNGCPICSVKDYEGGYGKKRFETHPEIKNKPAILYIINVYDDNESFIKIGITQKTVHERFVVNNKLPYKYAVLSIHPGTLYELFLIEQAVKKQLSVHKYKPHIQFNGHTECFTASTVDVLTKLVHKYSTNL